MREREGEREGQWEKCEKQGEGIGRRDSREGERKAKTCEGGERKRERRHGKGESGREWEGRREGEGVALRKGTRCNGKRQVRPIFLRPLPP